MYLKVIFQGQVKQRKTCTRCFPEDLDCSVLCLANKDVWALDKNLTSGVHKGTRPAAASSILGLASQPRQTGKRRLILHDVHITSNRLLPAAPSAVVLVCLSCIMYLLDRLDHRGPIHM